MHGIPMLSSTAVMFRTCRIFLAAAPGLFFCIVVSLDSLLLLNTVLHSIE
jgi:hypothetical protein